MVRGKAEQKGWLFRADLAPIIIEHILSGELSRDGDIVFTGFPSFSPQMRRLMDALEERGAQVQAHDPIESGDVAGFVASFNTRKDEALAAARWARAKIEKDPGCTVGIVTTDLNTYRPLIRNAMKSVVTPSALNPINPVTAAPWDLLQALPIAHFPAPSSALRALNLLRGGAQLGDVRSILLSPYFLGATEEAGSRAMLLNRLHRNGEGWVSLAYLTKLAGEEGKAWHCPILREGLDAVAAIKDSLPDKGLMPEWAHIFSKTLASVGWGNGRPLTPEELESVEEFKALFTSLAGLGVVHSEATLSRALGAFTRIASGHAFKPRRDAAAIRIVDAAAAAGCQFDYLWVMGMDSQSWPIMSPPNPFIPFALQRDAGVPESGGDSGFQTALALTRWLRQGASKVIFSYPATVDAAPSMPARMLSDLPRITGDTLDLSDVESWSSIIHRRHRDLQPLMNDEAPPLNHAHVGGGSAIIRDQANCPFKAFAAHRLHAQPIYQVSPGLDERERGNILHRILEKFWKSVGSHDALIQMSADDRKARIEDLANAELEALREYRPKTMTGKFIEIERERILSILMRWLELEEEREPFVVTQTEKRETVKTGGLEFTIVIDRVDTLVSDGSRCVLDYKTGQVSASKWFGERPEDPQLPLYSVSTDGDKSAIAFARLRAGQIEFSGVVKRGGILPGLPSRARYHKQVMDDWQGTLANWKESVELLAKEYKDGRADVSPTTSRTCEETYCELHALCRIAEKNRRISEGEPEK